MSLLVIDQPKTPQTTTNLHRKQSWEEVQARSKNTQTAKRKTQTQNTNPIGQREGWALLPKAKHLMGLTSQSKTSVEYTDKCSIYGPLSRTRRLGEGDLCKEK
jgi:hypothetical protein